MVLLYDWGSISCTNHFPRPAKKYVLVQQYNTKPNNSRYVGGGHGSKRSLRAPSLPQQQAKNEQRRGRLVGCRRRFVDVHVRYRTTCHTITLLSPVPLCRRSNVILVHPTDPPFGGEGGREDRPGKAGWTAQHARFYYHTPQCNGNILPCRRVARVADKLYRSL